MLLTEPELDTEIFQIIMNAEKIYGDRYISFVQEKLITSPAFLTPFPM